MEQHSPRRKKLVKPKLQLSLVGSFVGLAGLALLLQFMFSGYLVSGVASQVEGPGGQLAAEVPGIMLKVLVLSLAVLLPIIFAFGVLLTFRIAGPIYRFEKYLESVARGEQVGPCMIRSGDKLQSLCDRINEATAPLRHQKTETEGEPVDADDVRSAG